MIARLRVVAGSPSDDSGAELVAFTFSVAVPMGVVSVAYVDRELDPWSRSASPRRNHDRTHES